ncbi:MAG TPA: Clp protease N-terminal domain-containing protein [Streptosporangiaceae bacterium]|nr:Clp protease N-terminal domain-containing protein [Streptosporangiaceae bacterium]
MRPLEVPDLVVVATRVLGLDPDEALDLIDLDIAARAIRMARCDGPPEEAAARLLRTLLRHRPLPERNAEVAVVATLQLLALNGRELVIDRPEALRDLVRGLSAGSLSQRDAASWIGARIDRYKEAGMRKKKGISRLWGEQEPCRTPRQRRSVDLAKEEAVALGHGYVGTEHLLLGLIREGEGIAAQALTRLDVDADAVRHEIETIVGRGAEPIEGTPPFTPRAKRVLHLSEREARRLSHGYIGTEHLLLALVREGEGPAAQILVKLGVDFAGLVDEVMRIMRGGHPPVDVLRDGLGNLFEEYERLKDEVVRLRTLLRRHGIEPDGGTSQTA